MGSLVFGIQGFVQGGNQVSGQEDSLEFDQDSRVSGQGDTQASGQVGNQEYDLVDNLVSVEVGIQECDLVDIGQEFGEVDSQVSGMLETEVDSLGSGKLESGLVGDNQVSGQGTLASGQGMLGCDQVSVAGMQGCVQEFAVGRLGSVQVPGLAFAQSQHGSGMECQVFVGILGSGSIQPVLVSQDHPSMG